MTEIIFIIEDAVEGGYTAKSLNESIFTEAETFERLKENIREAVECHFEEGNAPKFIRLHWVREEVMAL